MKTWMQGSHTDRQGLPVQELAFDRLDWLFSNSHGAGLQNSSGASMAFKCSRRLDDLKTRDKCLTGRQPTVCHRGLVEDMQALWMQGSNTDRQGLTAQELAWLASMPNSARPASKNKTGLSKLVPKKSWIPGVSSKKQRDGSEASDTPRYPEQVCCVMHASCS